MHNPLFNQNFFSITPFCKVSTTYDTYVQCNLFYGSHLSKYDNRPSQQNNHILLRVPTFSNFNYVKVKNMYLKIFLSSLDHVSTGKDLYFFSNLKTLQCIECFISYVATSKINDHDHHLVRHLIIFTTIFGMVP